jgi:predicted dehydrogenase
VVGCGHWGPNHIRVFQALPDVTVSWAVDRDEGRRRHVASLFAGVRLTARYDDVLADRSVDAVVIATPASTHRDLALRAIAAGKHVLCEKPLATTSAECAELVGAAAARGVVLMVGHVFLFNQGILKLKELMDLRELGRLYYATAVRANLGPVRDDVNALFDLATHEVSILNFLFDAVPETVSACGRSYLRPGVEDVAFVTLSYPDDITAGITVSWLHPKKLRTLSVVGDKRMAVFDDLAATPLFLHAAGGIVEPYYDSYSEFHRLTRAEEAAIPPLRAEEPLQRQARAFIDAVARGDAGIASGERGGDVVRVLEAIEVSMRGGGAPVPVPAAEQLPARRPT